jgi:ubiquitin C-terminal hydrolase
MFGLPNISGSCWVNASLQGLFACPPVRDHSSDESNLVDKSFTEVYTSKGSSGLLDLFNFIRTSYIPAGHDIGDSHELIVHLCDKMPWLDELMRFKMANRLTCKTCGHNTLKEESTIEIGLIPSVKKMPIIDALKEYVQPSEIEGWDCDKCKEKRTCISQTLFGTFPKILMIHRSSISTPIVYTPLLILNKRRYELFAVICFNGGHWWSYGREDSDWFELDDTNVRQIEKVPVVSTMRILLYFLIEN